jgi:hypothetical protein
MVLGLGFLLTRISDLPGAMCGRILRQVNPEHNTTILLITTMIRSVINVLAIVALSWMADVAAGDRQFSVSAGGIRLPATHGSLGHRSWSVAGTPVANGKRPVTRRLITSLCCMLVARDPATPPTSLASQGANVLDQWLLVRMAHNSSAPCPGNGLGQCIDFSILGDNVNLSYSRYYTASGPFSQYLVLSGGAYWDDVSAGTGLAPSVVPLPAAGWLFASGLATLLGRRRTARD